MDQQIICMVCWIICPEYRPNRNRVEIKVGIRVCSDWFGQYRSQMLALKFELAVEVYGKKVSEVLSPHFEECLERSREVTFEEVESRSIPIRIRDALVWLLSP